MGKRKTKGSALSKKKPLSVLDSQPSLSPLSSFSPSAALGTNTAMLVALPSNYTTGKAHEQGPTATNSHSDLHGGAAAGPNTTSSPYTSKNDNSPLSGQQEGPLTPILPAMEANSSSRRDTPTTTSSSLLGDRARFQQFPPPPLVSNQADHRFNVFIKGLEPDMDSRMLFDLFKPYGYILSCKAVIDLSTGKCRGHGFVLYDNEVSVREARRALTPLGYYVAVAFDHVSLYHFENKGILRKPENGVPLPQKESAPQIDDDREFPCLPSSRITHSVAWSSVARRGDIRPNSADSSTEATPELTSPSLTPSPQPNHQPLSNLPPPSVLHPTLSSLASFNQDKQQEQKQGQSLTLPAFRLVPNLPSNHHPYSEPLGKALFGFDSGFFGSQMGMETFEGNLGANGSGHHGGDGGVAGGLGSLHERRISFGATVTANTLCDHNEEALYRDRDSRTLYIQNLELDCNDQKLRHICSEFGTVVSTKAIVDPWTGICEGHGFVTFDTELTAVRTLRVMRARGYVANLPDEAADAADDGLAHGTEAPYLLPSDLYQISTSLDDDHHGPLNVQLIDYLHQLASDTQAEGYQYHPSHVFGANASSPERPLRNGSGRVGDLQPYFDGREQDDFIEEPLEPSHHSSDSSNLDPPTIYFFNLAQGIRNRTLFELCALYGPLVLHLSDFEKMDDACSDGRGKVQLVSVQDAWKAIEGLSSMGYDAQLSCIDKINNRSSENHCSPLLTDDQHYVSDPAQRQLQQGHGEGFGGHAMTRDVMVSSFQSQGQHRQQADQKTRVANGINTPSPSLSASSLSSDCTHNQTQHPKNGSTRVKAFSFADAVKMAPTITPPTPPLSSSAASGKGMASNFPVTSRCPSKSSPPMKQADSQSFNGSAPHAIHKESLPVIRMPIPTDDDNQNDNDYIDHADGLTRMDGPQKKLEKSEYRMNLYVRDLEPTMTDLKLYEICVQFGRVLSCRVVMKHGACAGLGFVMFTTQESAEKARIGLKKLHGYHAHVAGHAATTKLRCKTMSETVFLMNLPTFVKEYHIRELFKHYGIVTCNVLYDPHTGKGKGVGFLKLKDLETAERFIHENHGRLMGKDWKLPLQVLPARR